MGDAASGLLTAQELFALAHLPMALTTGARHSVTYANPAFCGLVGKLSGELIGVDLADILPDCKECLLLLDRVYRTSEPETFQGHSDAVTLSYDIWSLLASNDRPAGIVIQVKQTQIATEQTVVMNEALLLGAIRQHEAAEAMETLNERLQIEMNERKAAEAALLRSERLASMGRMAASIAHEINNPLAAVMNTVYLARTTPGVPDEVCEYLATAEGELLRIAHITRQTLGFYHDYAEPTSISGAALLESVTGLLTAKIQQNSIIVRTECPQDLELVGVFGELRQVLANLLVNSLDAVGEHGSVRLRISRSGAARDRTGIRISVADSGRGMSAATLRQIFEPMFTTKGDIGTGLGLWVAKRLVEKHGGAFRVRSQTSGDHRGSTFSFLLPATFQRPEARSELALPI